MFKDLHRQEKQTSDETAIELLKHGEYGVLSTIDPNGYPYGVPLSYVYKNNAVYFHCGLVGHKLDNIALNPKVSFCVVNTVNNLPDKFTVSYESVVLYGKAQEIDGEEKQQALLALIEKYSSEHMEKGKKYVDSDAYKTKAVKIMMEKLTGKKNR